MCYRCDEWKAGEQYSAHQLKRQRKRVCVDRVGTETRPCSRCSKELMWRAFGNHWNEEADEKRLCLKCQAASGVSERRRCYDCGQLKSAQAFGATWKEEHPTRLCQQCKTQFYCAVCKENRPRKAFQENQLSKTRDDRKCNVCANEANNQHRCKEDIYTCNLAGGCQRVLERHFLS